MRGPKTMLAALAVVALVGAACGGDDDGGGDDGGDVGQGEQDCTWVIGTMGALSGDFATLGAPIKDGVEYAVDEANEAGDVPCTLELRAEDSQGNPEQAPQLAQGLIEDEELVAVAGPYFSGETLATGQFFAEAGVLMTGTGTNDTIDEQEFETWFRAVASDGVQGPVAADYITGALNPQRVAVVHDNQDYSKGLAETVLNELGDLADGPYIISPEETDYSSVVSEIKDYDPDVVYYGGYTPQAGPLLKQLQQAGVDAQFVSDDGAKDPSFGELAGEGAEGAVVTCPCVDPLKLEPAADFAQGMEDAYGRPPGTFAADMYDVTTFIIDALRELNGDEDIEEVRQHVVEYFDNAEGLEGIAKTYTWADNGEFEAEPLRDIWIYEWSNDAADFVSLGAAEDVIE
ncbi:MAG TPA: branched-chain amino acid ABC transporter substrate-binding protein [Actinomycetota bacterium]|nr:branched-chain amino acid ABC transporter substrate-binding protein [Actinomycetota bacterium]